MSNKPRRRRSKRIELLPEISYSETKKRSNKSSKSASKSSRSKPKRDQSERSASVKANGGVSVAPRSLLKVKTTTSPPRNDSPAGESATPQPISPTPSSPVEEDNNPNHRSSSRADFTSCATPKTARAHRRSITFGEDELAEFRWWESPSAIKRLGPCSIADDVTLSSEEEEDLHGESEVGRNSSANPYIVY
mmetsp:Transcript_1286/g.3035  ORF Transcript_1286/g.3035 Transcript_1286/m.3035 type:complete len:192 (+) Transcript_1286:337-912(+)